MEELSQKDWIFGAYPSLEATRNEIENPFTFFDIGDNYLGGVRINPSDALNTSYGLILAWDRSGNVVFRGGVDCYNGIAALGQSSGSFQRAVEHRGYRIGRKMAVAGLVVLNDYLVENDLPLDQICLRTDPGSSMANIAIYLGMQDPTGQGHYTMSEMPNLTKLIEEVHIKRIRHNEGE